MYRIRSGKLVMLIVTLLAFLSAPLAMAAWTPPTTLNTFTLPALPTNTSSVAVGQNGDSVAVWINEADSIIRYAIQQNGVWTTAKVLYKPNLTKGETTADVHVVIGPDGTARAIFASTIPGQVQYCVVGGRVVRCQGPNISYAKVSSLIPAATAWTKAVNVSAKGIEVSGTQIGLDQDGNAVAGWRYVQQAGAQPSLQVTALAAGGAWSPAETIYATANPWSLAHLSVGPLGDTMMVWQEKPAADQPQVIRSLSKPSQGSWGAVEDVATLKGQAWSLRGTVDRFGQSALVWDDDYAVWLARRSDGQGWSTPETLVSTPGAGYGPSGPFMAYVPDLAADAQGDLLISWSENDVAAGTWTVEAQMRENGGQIQAASWASDSMFGMPPVAHTAMSMDGSLGVVGWIDHGNSKVNTANFTPASGWARPVARGVGLYDTDARLACGPAAQASLVWLSNTATEFKYRYIGSSYRP